MLCVTGVHAQFESGGVYGGSISVIGEADSWTFTATNGDRIVLRHARLSATNSFSVRTRVYDPGGTLLGTQTGVVGEHAFTVASNGTYTVTVADASGPLTGTGTYRIYFVKLPGSFTIPPGDDGGPLPGSGEFQDGTIGSLGDMDLWTFPATAGERIVIRVAELSETNSFSTSVRIYGPDGVALSAQTAGSVKEYAFTSATSGTFTVLMADGSGPLTGTGTYRIYIVKLPGTFTVPAGDEGGEMTNGQIFVGAIELGDLDTWSFNACTGDAFTLQLDELTGGSAFLPQMRLYGRDGVLLNTISGQTTAQINRTAPATGTYTLVVADASGPLNGTGTYQLTALGIKSGLTLCQPVVTGANLFLSAAGGTTSAASVLLTSTNVATARTNWTPIWTNQFDQYGVFTRTYPFNPAEPQRHFLLQQQ
ncbi:MAG: hypothetical protein KIS67_07310 [Verrucomicrobiae bacterium]|nr:hypothetical protein [Verrucomicrobiae bacterium]